MVIQLSVLFDLTVCKHWNHMIPRPMFDHSCLLQKEINKVKIFPQLGSQSEPVSGDKTNQNCLGWANKNNRMKKEDKQLKI